MRRGSQGEALKAFPQWCVYNDVQLLDIVLASDNEKGNYFKPTTNLRNDEDNIEIPMLLTVPKDMVLSSETIQQYAKMDKNFRDIFHAAGHQSHRIDVLLFLLLQYIYASPDFKGSKGGISPWEWYFDMLPSCVPVPTMWNEVELAYLQGTSLETAVPAKVSALNREFDEVRAKCEDIPFWRDFFQDDETITVEDWAHLDALYRSRSLELPRSGESMVAVLDMVNHSQEANTYFEETLDGDVRLLIRRGYSIKSSNSEGSSDGGGGDEITIDYGQGKSAAEMLFSYGFVDSEATARSLVLPLESMNDDPLAKAKLHVFDGPPVIKLEDSAGDAPTWTAPFVYLMCLNEDDGIDFQVVQTIDGGRQLVLFWQGEDVTNKAANFETLISGHDLEPIIHLRAITVLITQLTEQVEKLETPLNCDREPSDPRFHFSLDSVWQLRRAELDLMQRTLAVLENQRNTLIENDRVKAYFGSMEESQNEETDTQLSNNDEDFS